MHTYWFTDRESGEDFFVEAATPQEARATARDYFDRPAYRSEVSTEWAEMQGWDTY